MIPNQFAYVGNWNFHPNNDLGISCCTVEADHSFTLRQTIDPSVRVGYLYVDPAQNLLYALDETDHRHGEIAGGGYLRVYRIHPDDGQLELLQERDTLGVNPSYFLIDPSRRYLLVSHHTLRSHITQIVRREDGTYTSKTSFDDASLVLFRLNADGTVGDAVDVDIRHGDAQPGLHPMAHLHCVKADPSGELFVVPDKGTDKIYTYHLDRVNGTLQYLDAVTVEDDCAPRYCIFHPTLPLVYVNNEHKPELHTFRYDRANGKLERIHVMPLLHSFPADLHGVEASDLIYNGDKTHLYTAIRGVDQIAVIRLGSDGLPLLQQTISYEGNNCRGLCLAEGGCALYVASFESGTVTRMAVQPDGSLSPAATVLTGGFPANLCLWPTDTINYR
jgi:6-phosphogluconolactonase (cycloisomerase 2 family)